MISPVIEFHNISLCYPRQSTAALQSTSFAVKGGESAVIRGPSGSGKSTLLFVAAGMLVPTSGTVRLLGQASLYEMDFHARSRIRRNELGLMLPDLALIPYLTAEQNLELAAADNRDSLRPQISDLLQAVKLEHRRAHLPSQLSTGEQRRIMFCRALVNSPKLLLCDEPVANLDEENGQLIWELIEDFGDAHRATIVVSHQAPINFSARHEWSLQRGQLTKSDVPSSGPR